MPYIQEQLPGMAQTVCMHADEATHRLTDCHRCLSGLLKSPGGSEAMQEKAEFLLSSLNKAEKYIWKLRSTLARKEQTGLRSVTEGKRLMWALWRALYYDFDYRPDNEQELHKFMSRQMLNTEKAIEQANYRWMGGLWKNGLFDHLMDESYGFLISRVSKNLGRTLSKSEHTRIDQILFAKKKLRLVLFDECNRNCPGCCNKDFDLPNLPLCTDYTPYNMIMLTGGEPMLHPEIVLQAVREIRQHTNAPIVLYTAMAEDKEALGRVLDQIEGITLTLHDSGDIEPFREFNYFYDEGRGKGKFYRVNVFAEAGRVYTSPRWKAKTDVQWLENCPLPEGEVLMRYTELTGKVQRG